MIERFFNAEHYARQLGGGLSTDETILDHYQRFGESQGLCPGPDFDPVAFKIARPDLAARGDLLSVFARLRRDEPGLTAPTMAELFPDIPVDPSHCHYEPGIDLVAHDRCDAEQAKAFAAADEFVLPTAKGAYKFHAPPADLLLERLANDAPLSLMRYPHGFWTCLTLVNRVRRILSRRLPEGLLAPDELTNAVIRLCRERMAGALLVRTVFIEGFLTEVEKDLQAPLPANVLCGVAFKGYPTLDRRLFIIPGQGPHNDRLCAEITNTFSRHFSPDNSLIDGATPKRWAISGSLRGIAEALKSRSVIVIGPPWFSSLGRRLGLTCYAHVAIASKGTFGVRHTLLARALAAARAALRTGGRRPVMLFQCGGSLAAWLIRRLHAAEPGVFYWDFGQALTAWHLDEAFYDFPWMKVYKSAMIQNNGLEGMYRELAGPHHEQWLGD